MFMKHYAPTDVNQALNFRGRGDQGRCERRSEVFVKIQNKNNFLGGMGRVGGGDVDHGRCEQRSKVFVKIQKKNGGGSGLGGGGSGWM